MTPKDTNFNNIKIRKPQAFLYYFVTLGVKIITKLLFRVKCISQGMKGLKGPFVVISNHAGVMDIALLASSMLPHRLNIVASTDLFTWPLFKPFITKLGCIPKSQFAVDVMALKMMKAAVEQGRKVALYPEGKTSLDGKQQPYIAPSIGKLIKYLDVPVVFVLSQGSYLTKPRYFKGFRYGKIVMNKSLLLSADEVKELSAKQIYERLEKAFRFNENLYQIENNIRFRSKRPALGMEFLLYRCPKCGLDYKMRTTDRRLICDYCGNNVEYTEYGRFIPDAQSVAFERIDLWYEYQRQSVDKEIAKPDFFISNPVDMYEDKDRTYKLIGEGELYIDKEKIGYKGTKNGLPYEVSTPLKTIYTITTKNEEGVDLVYPDEGSYRFLFKGCKGATKYGIIVERMYRLIHNLDGRTE